jgi:hypothetical protein
MAHTKFSRHPTYADILTSHQDLAYRKKVAGGIERHAIRVIPGEATSRMTTSTWQLMPEIHVHLTHNYNPSLQDYSDCASASAHINTTISSHNDKLCTKNAVMFMSAAYQMANVRNQRKRLWSQGHPERRLKKNEKPNEEQKAITIADDVADGRATELQVQQLPTIQHTLALSHIYNELIPVDNGIFA